MRHKFLERDALMAIGTALLALLQNIQYRLQNNPEFTAVGLWLMTGVYTLLVSKFAWNKPGSDLL